MNSLAFHKWTCSPPFPSKPTRSRSFSTICLVSSCSIAIIRLLSSQRSCEKHPLPKLLPRQIPLDGQTIIAFPAAGDPNLKLEAPHGTDSSQTPRWSGMDSNVQFRAR